MLNTEFWIFSIICLLSALPRCFLAVALNCSGCWAIIVRIAKNSAKSNLHFWSVQISLPLKPLLFVCKKKISSGFHFYVMLLSLFLIWLNLRVYWNKEPVSQRNLLLLVSMHCSISMCIGLCMLMALHQKQWRLFSYFLKFCKVLN